MDPALNAAAQAAVNAAAAPPWRGRTQLGGLGAFGLILLLVLTPPPVMPLSEPELCVVRALDPRIAAPWLSVPRRAPGCSSHGRLGPGGVEVHALRLLLGREAATDWTVAQGLPLLELVLNATPHNASTAPLVLLLATDRPVTWRITANGISHLVKHTLTVCEECRVDTDLKSITVTKRDWLSKRALLRHANKTWHALTSFTEVHGANRVELKVGYGVAGEESGDCNTSSRQQSPVASASLTQPQPSQGCLNKDSIGHNPRDVYVVELQGKNPGPGAVQVLLQGEGPKPVPCNVTLVLKARRPTRWQLGSHGIDGSIIVVSDQQVENAGVDVVVRSKHLPDGLDELLLTVFAEFGRPVLYVKTERASGLRLLVPSREYDDERLSGDMAGDERDITSTVTLHQVMQQPSGVPAGAPFFSGFPVQESHARPLAELRREMKVNCELKRMNVSFPRSIVTRLGVRKLTLNDPSCVAQSNDTHFWLSSSFSTCGSLSSSVNGATHYSNSVHIRFGPPAPSDDEDGMEEEASGAFEDPDKDPDKLPILCKYLAQFPGGHIPITPGDEVNTESMERHNNENLQSKNGNIYQMELYRDQEHTRRVQIPGTSPPLPAEVQFDETIYWSEFRWSPRAVGCRTPQIQITNTQESNLFEIPALWTYLSKSMTHLLQVQDLTMVDLVFSLLPCVNQAQHCFRGHIKGYDGKMVSTAQQLVSRGPMQPVARRRVPPSPPTSLPIPNGGVYPEYPGKIALHPVTPTPAPLPAAPKTASVVQGISAEVAAGIALLSFFVGVCLTASLWFIQLKTDPMRQHRSKEAVQQQQQRAAGVAGPATALVKPDGSQSSSAAI
ncbi:hypothetical protein B566_EDAN016249 [Ephemera danica]|nr:hypothetical protein B566_EDAN016249 [Ephemera danica]